MLHTLSAIGVNVWHLSNYTLKACRHGAVFYVEDFWREIGVQRRLARVANNIYLARLLHFTLYTVPMTAVFTSDNHSHDNYYSLFLLISSKAAV